MEYVFTIHPLAYTAFGNEAEQIDKCKEWGLLSEKAVKIKSFYYKRDGTSFPCGIVGFVDKATAVIQFDNGRLHCIHPSFLKEMQASNYGVKAVAADNSGATDAIDRTDTTLAVKEAQDGHMPEGEEASEDGPVSAPASGSQAQPATAGTHGNENEQAITAESDDETERAAAGTSGSENEQTTMAESENEPERAAAGTSGSENEHAATAAPLAQDEGETESADSKSGDDPKKGKSKKEKLELPEGKVSMTATVQEFATVPNHFSDNDDEVVIYEAVSITEPDMELGVAWSSHSATLKKLELAIGDTIAFEAKVIAKKLTKHPVPYKINNPAKIQKLR